MKSDQAIDVNVSADMVAGFPSFESLRDLIVLARREDLGGDDPTSRLLVSGDAQGEAIVLQKAPGIACGLPIVPMVCGVYDPRLTVEPVAGASLDELEGRERTATPTPLLRVRGPVRSLLSAERVILNFLQRLSGVATLTHRFVQRVRGTGARIYDTRKTTPGWRLLEKYAVRCGGGFNHRMGLHDGLLVKDNHIAAMPLGELCDHLSRIVAASRAEAPQRMIEVEVTTLDQLSEVLKVQGVDLVLLDNMDCPTMRRAVLTRDAAGAKGRVELEASGGVNLDTVRAVAETGVDRIAIGAITHSATALDISMEIGH